MGASVLGASILAGASLVGTGATLATNASNQAYGAAQSDAARKWSTNERIASQEYNTQERLAAQEYNTSERLATQDYNSIPNQAMQFRSAGLNPNALGNAVGFQGASPGHSQGSSSSPGSPGLSGIGTAQVPNIPQLISSGADLVNALSKNSETKATLPLINEQVKNYILKNFGQETTNSILDLEKQLKSATLPAKVKQEFELLAKLGFDKMISQQQGKNFEQQNLLLKQQEKINELIQGLKGEELIQAQYLTARWNEIQDSIIGMNKAKASESSASASNLLANTEQTKFFTSLYKEPAVRESLSNQIQRAADNALKDGSIKEEQAKLIQWQAAQLEKATNNYEIMMWSNIINQTINTAANAVGEFTKFGLVKKFLEPKGSFDPNAGRGFTINQDNGLLFRNGM